MIGRGKSRSGTGSIAIGGAAALVAGLAAMAAPKPAAAFGRCVKFCNSPSSRPAPTYRRPSPPRYYAPGRPRYQAPSRPTYDPQAARHRQATALNARGLSIAGRAHRSRSTALMWQAIQSFRRAYALWPHPNIRRNLHLNMGWYLNQRGIEASRRRDCAAAANHFRQSLRWSSYSTQRDRQVTTRNLTIAQRCAADRALTQRRQTAQKVVFARLAAVNAAIDRIVGDYIKRWTPKPKPPLVDPAACGGMLGCVSPAARNAVATGRLPVGATGGFAGKVEICSKDTCRRVTSSGVSLRYGERVRTGPKGRLQILLIDRTTFAIGPDSDIALDDFVYDPKAPDGPTVRMAGGVLRFAANKLAREARTKPRFIVGPMAVGIRGTDFSLRRVPNKRRIEIALFEGRLEITPEGSAKPVPIEPGLWTITWTATEPRSYQVVREIDTGAGNQSALARRKAAADAALPVTPPPGVDYPKPPGPRWDIALDARASPDARAKLVEKLDKARAALVGGTEAARDGKWDQAVKQYKEALDLTSYGFRWPNGMAPEPLIGLASAYDRQGRLPLTAATFYRAYLGAAPDTPLASLICTRIGELVRDHDAHARDLLAQATTAMAQARQVCTPGYCDSYVGFVNAAQSYATALVFAGRRSEARRFAERNAWDAPYLTRPGRKSVFGPKYWVNFGRRQILGGYAEALAQTGDTAAAIREFRLLNALYTKPFYRTTVEEVKARHESQLGLLHLATKAPAERPNRQPPASFWYQRAIGNWSSRCAPLGGTCSHDRARVVAGMRAAAARRRKRENDLFFGGSAITVANLLSDAARSAVVRLYLYRRSDQAWADYWKATGRPRPGGCG